MLMWKYPPALTYVPDLLCHVLAFPFRIGAQPLAAFAHRVDLSTSLSALIRSVSIM